MVLKDSKRTIHNIETKTSLLIYKRSKEHEKIFANAHKGNKQDGNESAHHSAVINSQVNEEDEDEDEDSSDDSMLSEKEIDPFLLTEN
jgi:hypothetical protein